MARPTLRHLGRAWPGLAFVVIAVVHLVLLLLGSRAAETTQWLLMPPLIAYVLLNCRSVHRRLVRMQLTALILSWMGDSLPFLVPQDSEFLLRIALFMLAQLVFIVAFWPYRRGSIFSTRPQLLAPYGIALVGLVALCAPGAHSLWPLLALYGAAVIAVAALATGVNGVAALGGVAFVVSDGLIAARLFIPAFTLPQADFWAMLTYLLAQGLITRGVVARDTGQPLWAGRPTAADR